MTGTTKTLALPEEEAKPNPTPTKILLAYFSWSGNTRETASQIHDIVGGNLFEIVSVDRYPLDYDETVKQAGRELKEEYRPKLRNAVERIESYDVVFIGYPNWWGTIPMPVATFLSEYDFSGKTIVPFCCHEGSRLGRSVTDIRKLCPKSTVMDGIAVRSGDVRGSQNAISKWLREIGMAE